MNFSVHIIYIYLLTCTYILIQLASRTSNSLPVLELSCLQLDKSERKLWLIFIFQDMKLPTIIYNENTNTRLRLDRIVARVYRVTKHAERSFY